ncbi:MAG: DUF2971 domain-containing protein [Treponema sp.]
MKKNCFILRKYTKCSIYDIENILRRRVSVTSPKNFNDPLDSYCLDFNDEGVVSSLEKVIPKNKRNAIRMTCFADHETMLEERKKEYGKSLSNAEILMWTHYANAHYGVCIEYAIPRETFKSIDDFVLQDSDSIYLEKVAYNDNLAVDYERAIQKRTNDDRPERLLSSVYFLKDKTFQYEHEFRLLCFISGANAYYSVEFNYISKIVFGMRCNNDTRYLIECINRQVYDNKIELFEITKKFEEVSCESR